MLPFEPAAGQVQPETTDESQRDEISEPATRRRRHPGRRRLPADLPRERIEVVPPVSVRHCTTCDTAKVRIGADTTEELDYVPASFVIREYVRPKYACVRCQQGVVQAVLPARPIEKGRPGPGLLAHVVSSKYADHLPLYRLEQIFERHGMRITRRTLSEWNGTVQTYWNPSCVPCTGSRCASRPGFNATTRPWMCRTRVERQRFGPGVIGVSWARWCTTSPSHVIRTGR